MRVFVLIVLSLLPTLASAHPGHDHSSPYAGLVHLLWLAPVIIAAALLYSKSRNRKNNHSNEQ
ncbi:hypothetical protein G3R49_17135 [Shewanella sp. WXL01]|uniref:DUF6732 family protein n=1 Tax=Shewanella sp. WXL01 TaxID=2709721 RepID=UPI001438615F|nr:DUF6732 family protein [Shewanella sp. WXL01]NKF52286.1 hypothetical protein [Shewanella sp. WXL01]